MAESVNPSKHSDFSSYEKQKPKFSWNSKKSKLFLIFFYERGFFLSVNVSYALTLKYSEIDLFSRYKGYSRKNVIKIRGILRPISLAWFRSSCMVANSDISKRGVITQTYLCCPQFAVCPYQYSSLSADWYEMRMVKGKTF